MIGFSIFIDKKLHITRHLSSSQVAFHKQAFVNRFIPHRCPPFLIFFRIQCIEHGTLCFIHIKRKHFRINTFRTNILERPGRRIRDGHRRTGCCIAFSFQFQMEPHDKLLRLFIIDYFWTFHYTSLYNVTGRIVQHYR